uniref:Neprosin PEP catalytic domain-containing protein n=1 Tax=Chenopodium quinoa TaxID=63459 RepID=A0A803LQG6_CHEQI
MQIATVVASTNSIGVSGHINVWSPVVLENQLSDTSVFVASYDGALSNAIQAGWMVNSDLKQNSSRFYAYWTKDTGKTTGCYNALCPGFVQVSQRITLGQDQDTKNWWLSFGTEGVGYFPKELFSTLTEGATRVGWGGEVNSPTTAVTPAMGSGHFPEEGYAKACLISKMRVIGPQFFLNGTDLKQIMTKPNCYRAKYGGDVGGDYENHMFVGRPGNCVP